jgi:hypothetical protein
MIPAIPTIPAAIPPTTAPVEMFVPELVASPLSPVEEGLDEIEVSEDRVNEVTGSDVFGVEVIEVLVYSRSAWAGQNRGMSKP